MHKVPTKADWICQCQKKSPDCTASSNTEYGIIIMKRMPAERGFNTTYLGRHEEEVFSIVVDDFVVSIYFTFHFFTFARVCSLFVNVSVG